MIEEKTYEMKGDPLEEYYVKTIDYDRVLEGNLLLWTEYLDNCLKDYVIRYNFNFFEVANRFHEFISFPYKYDFSEEECRFHWSFLHSARSLNIVIDDDYYKRLKEKNKDFTKKPKTKNEYTDVVEILDEELVNQNKLESITKPMQISDVKNLEVKEISKIIKEEKPEEENLMKKIMEMNERNREENLRKLQKENINSDEKIEKDIENDQDIDNKKDENEEENNLDHNGIYNKIFKTKFNFQQDNSDFNLAFEKKEEEDDIIEALFNNKVISDFMKDDNPKSLPKKDENIEEFPINRKIVNEEDDNNSEVLSNASFEEIRQRKKREKTMDGFSSEINKTKNIDDFIQENPELKRQYENLNKYYDFAMKSLKYLIPKFIKGNDDNEEDESKMDEKETLYIERTTQRINNLIAETVKAKDNQEESKEEEDNNFYSVKENYNPILNAPLTEEQKDRMNKFRNYLIQDARNNTTHDLLENIANVITNIYTEETEEEKTKIDTLTEGQVKKVNNFFELTGNDNNNTENKRVIDGNNQNEMNENNNTNKKYPYYYRGILCYSDKPMNTTKKENDEDELSD